jgi:hypothetical protein
MALLLFPVHFIATLLALLLGYDWWTTPASLELAAATEIVAEPVRGRSRNREVVVLRAGDHRYEIACAMAKPVCDELDRRPITQLRSWIASPGLLAGDWLLQAEEGGRHWIVLGDQQAAFAAMKRFYAWCAAIAWSLALGLGWLLYFRRARER